MTDVGDHSEDDPPWSEREAFALADKAARHIENVSGAPSHDVAVILGTGLAAAVSSLGSSSSRHDIGPVPGLPVSFVSHQRSELWSLEVGGHRVLAFLGRLHLYEGYSASRVVHPVRTAMASGCHTIVLTNASGSLRPVSRPGDIVLIADHLNLTGRSPLSVLPVDVNLPNAFVDVVDTWSPRLRHLAREVDPSLAEGVYAQVAGPQFETPAEIRMLRTMGADLVGMSSVLEAIAVRQLGHEVLGLSLVTNMAAGMTAEPVSPTAIVGTAEGQAEELGRIIRQVVLAL